MKRLIILLFTLITSVAPLRAAFDNGQVVTATSVSEQALLNGRVYDPQTGRFLSADPVVQEPDYLQNYNRYSYCLNNPLVYVDPSGYSTNGTQIAYTSPRIEAAKSIIATGTALRRVPSAITITTEAGTNIPLSKFNVRVGTIKAETSLDFNFGTTYTNRLESGSIDTSFKAGIEIANITSASIQVKSEDSIIFNEGNELTYAHQGTIDLEGGINFVASGNVNLLSVEWSASTETGLDGNIDGLDATGTLGPDELNISTDFELGSTIQIYKFIKLDINIDLNQVFPPEQEQEEDQDQEQQDEGGRQ